MNDMRLPSSGGWNSPDHFQKHSWMLISNSAPRYANISVIIVLVFMSFTYFICNNIL
jgi:hypothetical protein